MEKSAKLRDLYEVNKSEPSKVGNVCKKIFDLKRQMIEATIDTQNHIEELFTSEQIIQLKDTHHSIGT